MLVLLVISTLPLAGVTAGAEGSGDKTPKTPEQQAIDDKLAKAKEQQQLVDQVRLKLGSNLADALSAQTQLDRSLKDNAEQQVAVQNRIADADARIAATDAEIDRLQRRIAATEIQVDLERRQLSALARAIYTQPQSLIVMLAEARSLSDMLTRTSDVESAGRRARSLKLRIEADLSALQADRASEANLRQQQLAVREQLGRDLQSLQELRVKQERSKSELEAKMADTRKELDSVANQAVELAQKIAKLLEEEQQQIIATAMQQVWDQLQLWEQHNPIGELRPSSKHSKKFRFVWPLPTAQVSQGFGPSDLGLEPAMNGFAHFHAGIDLVMPSGTPVEAADDGVVALVGTGGTGYGNYVVIAHQGGLSTLYGHLIQALVKPGDTIAQGQPIGLEGSTGNSTGPHLHFEVRMAGRPVDPAPFLPPGSPTPFRD